MPQIFHRSTNVLAKASIFGSLFIAGGLLWLTLEINRSSYVTGTKMARPQPVQFSHKHHVGDDGIDCRYCHTSVEISPFAGIPPTATCMNCHSLMFADSPYLEPVRASYENNEPLEWTRVHDLPEYVYFNHAIHVNKGVGCVECHGRVDEMPLTYQVETLHMEWCLDCHRNPEAILRPKEEIYNMAWTPPADQEEAGAALAEFYQTPSTAVLTSCGTCHR